MYCAFKQGLSAAAGVLICATLLTTFNCGAQVEFVDPTIGNVGHLLEPTRPTVSIPNSPLRVYPVRRDGLDDQIHSFPLSIISHRLGELFWLMPHDGEPDAAAWGRPAGYDQEVSTPYYYSVRLEDSMIRVDFTPTERCGFFRFSFPSGKPVVLLANLHDGQLLPAGDHAFTGVERFNDMQAYVYGEFNRPVRFTVSEDHAKSRLAITAIDNQSTLEMRYAISYLSTNQARENLSLEIPAWNFDRVKWRARDAWNHALGQIQVEGGTPEQRRVFYTALYRCYERMVNITEGNHYYSAFDHQVHEDRRPFYVDNWIWDLYRGLCPLQTLLNPEKEADKLQSYVRMYQQEGWMPSFAVLWGDNPCMTGNHAAAWMADAWFKGVRDFDLKTAYAGLRKNSLEATLLPWRNGPKCSLDDFYNEHGYYPALHPDEKETVAEVHPFEKRQAISVTLEQSYDDWCTAQIARELGNEADYQLFLKRAANYKNVYRQDKGFMWPKDAQGQWIEPFDPKFSGGQGGRDYTTENNDYTYNWDAQHDFAGLAELMGGTRAAEAKLDDLFRADLGRSKYAFQDVFPDSTGMVGEFSMGNEPSFVIPYIYNHLGAPWKTQKRTRQLLDCWFTDTQLGMPGDEDGGGMSAFVVFSMMGFFPVVPGVPVYELTSPVFDLVTIHFHDGKSLRVVCKDNSRQNKYIKSFSLNGQTQDRLWFKHSDAIKGATLELEMSDTPNVTLGVKPETFPPSSMKLDPKAFE
jgi:predicted alpha-1,2-mannosidase